jgi:hypothetical protein
MLRYSMVRSNYRQYYIAHQADESLCRQCNAVDGGHRAIKYSRLYGVKKDGGRVYLELLLKTLLLMCLFITFSASRLSPSPVIWLYLTIGNDSLH